MRLTAGKPELSKRKREIEAHVQHIWEDRWERETRGETLRRFFPDVKSRILATWVAPDHETSQLLTGHGCFNERLNALGLVNDRGCECGNESEDLHHVLWECTLYEDIRKRMLDEIVRLEEGPVYYRDLVSSEVNYNRLREFAHQWHKRRNSRHL